MNSHRYIGVDDDNSFDPDNPVVHQSGDPILGDDDDVDLGEHAAPPSAGPVEFSIQMSPAKGKKPKKGKKGKKGGKPGGGSAPTPKRGVIRIDAAEIPSSLRGAGGSAPPEPVSAAEVVAAEDAGKSPVSLEGGGVGMDAIDVDRALVAEDAAHRGIGEEAASAALRLERRRGRVRLKRSREARPAIPEELVAAVKGSKPWVSVVTIGHVDAGKSTLLGHLLHLRGSVDARAMGKLRRNAEGRGKGSFALAFVMDDGEEERERGVTIDVATARLETEHRDITLLDAPGHKDYVSNAINAVAAADAALLVVPAVENEFRSAFAPLGQTREHAVAARSLGVSQVVVVVSKMDLGAEEEEEEEGGRREGWQAERFLTVAKEVGKFLVREAHFRAQNITCVPVSGLNGTNLIEPVSMEWYARYCRLESERGPIEAADTMLKDAMAPVPKSDEPRGRSLLEVLDTLRPASTKAVVRPLRLVVQSAWVGAPPGRSGPLGVVVAGRVESGWLATSGPTRSLVAVPSGASCSVKWIAPAHAGGHGHSGDSDALRELAWTGQSVLVGLGGVEPGHIRAGAVLCLNSHPVHAGGEIKARIRVPPVSDAVLVPGQQLHAHIGVLDAPCMLLRIVHREAPDETVLQKHPPAIRPGETAVVRIRFHKTVPVEPFKDSKRLGRFILRYGDITVGAGRVLRVYK